MSLPVVLRAAQLYADAEAARLAAPHPTTDTLPDFSALPNVAYRDSRAHLRIDPRHQPRVFEVPVAFFLKVAEALGANLLFNCRTRRSDPATKAYVRLDFGPVGISVNRIIMDAPIGCVVRERGTDYRSHLPEDLIIRDAPLKHGPGKHITGRQDAIEAILKAYDQADEVTRGATSRPDLEYLLNNLLAVADARAAERLRYARSGGTSPRTLRSS